ncbi:MotA/TolQ/ExbB proton channel family protein [Flavobacterium piscisymbiosum]|uniref:MotA/TolQ/ExbB proton channel family protein n=1 Tax=Flavobacterium piscisymbiosum TaxID=2893753 RepID=A0ABS8MG32_9FLAO|nr:MotA/TolQ/ExbB proton channel family protein [Flavobacterium sp. F-30]MCC9063650.1 MotA/TolQ/ExbB proton channel family protein [Flavobacterium sp. F-30]
MTEISVALIIFAFWTSFSVVYYKRYKRFQLNADKQKANFWNNSYIFDIIPSVFPTLGIFCTALGITIGIWNFDTTDIQGSIPQLLDGLKIAFIATMAGIIGLILFQKWNALIQMEIEESPNRPVKHTDELSAINALSQHIIDLKESLIVTIEKNLEEKVAIKLSSLESEIVTLNKTVNENHKSAKESITQLNTTTNNSRSELNEQFKLLREESKAIGKKSNDNTKEIINAMTDNNKFIVKKFDEFSELMSKNNTEALVDVMKNVTEQFNKQMSELINRLVQENFAELNKSVQSMNDWQKDNKDQIKKLTNNFQKTTELFDISSKTLSEVALNSKSLIDDNSKLVNLVETLEKVMVSDNKFSEITNNLVSTIDTLKETTDSFEETTSKLNDWVRTERNFKDSADIIIVKLEEFRDFKSDVWMNYRKEMDAAVGIIEKTTISLSKELSEIDTFFYDRLSNTLENLDLCIQRFLPENN